MAKTTTPNRPRKLSSVPPPAPSAAAATETPAEAARHGEAAAASDAPLAPTAEDRQRRIEERAYRRAEERGFAPGAELEDWLAAEREIDAELGRTSN